MSVTPRKTVVVRRTPPCPHSAPCLRCARCSVLRTSNMPLLLSFMQLQTAVAQKSLLILVHLSRGGAEVQMFAPDVSQMHVIDHGKGQPVEKESRNVLSESARIARGSVTDLAKLNVGDHDAVIFPGGFGAAKNLSTFASDGKDCKVNKEVERVLKGFHKAGKPIGLCCISPVLAAKVLPGVDVTVGHEEEEGGKWPYAGTTQAITALGAKHTVKEVTISYLINKVKRKTY
ncbi:Glutamine amidotransferase-like class 1 domain-containing protein 3A, mitochondrial [Labeo rohita]|uniref:Glutamine amidotransferase-like class 1 domain-containing protein 3A, mitochondrial n=1 Tax=Labeo rohita TaxID=84645 RepID=A0ABQ8MCY0_LABRO|nr:Glutamine amidotransferase-like class 1 domain-containing protein 3A, mitochondrial [Labeo rohita]